MTPQQRIDQADLERLKSAVEASNAEKDAVALHTRAVLSSSKRAIVALNHPQGPRFSEAKEGV